MGVEHTGERMMCISCQGLEEFGSESDYNCYKVSAIYPIMIMIILIGFIFTLIIILKILMIFSFLAST